MNRVGWTLAACAAALTAWTPADARKPTPAERERVGRYFVGDSLDHRLCAITLSFEPSVGGELETRGCAAFVPELDEATGWWVDSDRDGPTFVDAMHKVRAAFADSDGGLIANLGNGRGLTLEPYTESFLAHPGAGLPGRWSFANAGGDDPTGGCTVHFVKGGSLAAARACPAALRATDRGHWLATSTSVTLVRAGKRLALAWGASRDTLFIPGGAFRLQRVQ